MLVLFDNNIPRGLARTLKAHTIVEARARSRHLLKNGELRNFLQRSPPSQVGPTDANSHFVAIDTNSFNC